MARDAELATHSRAGSFEPRHLAVRLPEATATKKSGESISKIAGGTLRIGTHRVGSFELQVVLQANGDVRDAVIPRLEKPL